MARASNTVDFWRGFALIEIFINHIPGNLFEPFTHKSLSPSDSAELFVFLAGWSLKYVVGPDDRPLAAPRLIMRLFLRAGKLYAAHMVIVMMAIAMLAATARLLDNPLVLDWFNASAVFSAPVETHIGLVLLTHQLGYFDILPLYIVLLVASPFIALLDRHWPMLLLPLSVTVYLVALVGQITFPTWPTEGEWFFDPLCWQLAFVMGFVMGRPNGAGDGIRRHLTAVRIVAVPVVVAAAVLRFRGIELDPTTAPEPHLLFVNDKSFLTPTRIIHFLLLAALVVPTFGWLAARLPRLVGALSLLGRNSLLVFCTGSILSLAAQILRFAFRGDPVLDTIFIAGGLVILFTISITAEWWERVR